MSADGEVQVQVSAEGVDDAAEELSEGGGGAGGGGGDGPSGVRGSLRAGLAAGVITSLAGPLLEVLDPILSALQAFLAPVAALALRLLAPYLRAFLTKVLPKWISFLDVADSALPKIRDTLLGAFGLLGIVLRFFPQILNFVQALPSKVDRLITKIGALPQRIWSFVKQLSEDIITGIGQRFPDVASRGTDTVTDTLTSDRNPAFRAGQRVGNINISGGLAAFIEEVETTSGVDFP